jgi:Metallo-peptidase family M12B Reprolysin-like/Immunoglobulin domain/Dockerin type I domain
MTRTNFTRLLSFLLCLPVTFLFAQSKQISWQYANIQSQLNNAPLEGSLTGKTFALPMPDGSDEQVMVWESPIISMEMKAQLPSIKTYVVKGLNNTSITGRVMISNLGFHGTVFNDKGQVYFERVGTNNNQYKISYVQREAFECRSELGLKPSTDGGGEARTYSNGSVLRLYRFAVVTTPEFVAGNGGTNASANTIVAQHVNSLNALYEKELAIRFTLQTPYNSPTTIAFQDLNAVQTILTAQITAGYDVGHCFHHESTAGSGSGLAGLSIACLSGNKGRGWSGASPSNGTLFMGILYHEVGHQFSATHTYNGSGSSCTTISSSSSYEIGSGTTIMAYPGVCAAAQNINQNGDTYFHTHSLQQMVTYAAAGGNCSVNSASNNTPPVVNANPSGATYNIPKSTPFELTGSGTDADGDPLTYCWEQYDEDGAGATPTQGFIGATAGASALAPLFRSYLPVTSPTRTFPALNYILTNTAYDFEPLPSVARTMNFRLTGRDNKSVGGGIHCSAVAVNVINTATPFAVTSQNSATTWTANGSNTATVTWDVAGTTAAPISCANVTILFSADGGITFPYTLVASTLNNGSASFIIPSYPTTVGRVKVKCANGNIFFDINNANITIASSCAAEAASIASATALTAPVGDAALSFSLTPQYGTTITPITGSITTTDPISSLVGSNTMAVPCTNFGGNQTNYDIYQFQVSVTGNYTFTKSSGVFGLVATIYNGSFIPTSPCANFIASSYDAAANSINNTVTTSLSAGIVYQMVIHSFAGGMSPLPVLPASYTYNATSVPTGGGVFSGTPNPGASFNYAYVVVNTGTGNVVGIQAGNSSAAATVNMTVAATYPAGTYQVYGLSYINTTTLASLQGTYVGQPFTTLQSALALLTFCGDLSSNSKTVTITAPSCTPPTVSTQPAATTNLCSGATLTLTVAATGGTTPYTYQWKKGATNVSNGGAISGAASATLTINPIAATDAGTYTCVITDATSCSVTSANAVVNVNAAPAVFSVTGGGAYCTGGTAPLVGLSNSVSGTNYQLQLGGVNTGSPVGGTNAALGFGAQSTAGTYTVVATLGSCTASMTGSAVVSINPLPSVFNVTGGGSYCAGGTGVAIDLDNSTSGVSYQLKNGATNVVAVNGTGAAISFGNQTTAGTYTVVATITATGCTATMTGSAVVSINPLPTFTATPTNPTSCASANGSIALNGLTASTNYTVAYTFNGTPVAAAPLTSNAAGTITLSSLGAGSYTNIIVTLVSTGCPSAAGSTSLVAPSAPTAAVIAGTATICNGSSTNLTATITGGTSPYTLVYSNGANQTVNSYTSGSNISVSPTMTTTYTLVSVTDAGGCAGTGLSGSAVVTVNPIPTFTVAPTNPTSCVTSNGSIALNGLTANTSYSVTYTLLGTPTVTTLVSNASGVITISGLAAGTYSNIRVTLAGCQSTAATTGLVAPGGPTAAVLAGTTAICSGSSTNLTATITGGVSPYTLVYSNGANQTVNSYTSGSNISVSPTMTTTYTLVSVTDAVGCAGTGLSGSAVVTVNPTPSLANAGTSQTICGVLSTGLAANTPSTGTGAWSIVSGPSTAIGQLSSTTSTNPTFTPAGGAGVYTFRWTISTAAPCTPNTSDVTVTIVTPPTAFNVTGGGSYCAGGTGVVIGLSNSTSAVSYQLKNGATNVGMAVIGTGAAISFGNQIAAGTYTVVATGTSSCTTTMTGSVMVAVNSLPTFTVASTNPTSCIANNGSITLNGLTASTNYTVAYTFNGTPVVAAPLTSNAAGIITLSSLGAGSYTNIIATLTSTACPSAAATANLVAPSAPTAAVLAGTATICNGSSTNLTATITGGTSPYTLVYSNGANQTVNSYTSGSNISVSPTMTTTYTLVSVTDAGGCAGTGLSGSAVVTVNSVPTTANAGSPQTICATGTATLAANVPATGTGAWSVVSGPSTASTQFASVSVNNTTFTPTAAGTYTLRWTIATAAPCTPSTSDVVITVNAATSVANAGAAQTICTGFTATLAANTPTVGTAAWSILAGSPNTSTAQLSSTTSSTAVFTPTAAGTYTLRWTITGTAPCVLTSTSDVVITVGATPTVAAVAAQPFCGGNSASVTLTGSAGSTLNWTNSNAAIGLGVIGSGNISFTAANVSTATVGNIVVTPSLGTCTGTTQNFTITINPTPTVNSVSTVNACTGKAIAVTLASTPTGATINWTNTNTATGIGALGSGNIAATAAATASVLTSSISATATLGTCTGAATVFAVNVNPAPISTLVSSAGILPACPFTNVTLTATGGTSYNWGALSTLTTSPITVIVPAVTPSISYSVTATNGNACTSVASTTVNVNPVTNPACLQPLLSNIGFNILRPGIKDPCTCIGGNVFTEDVIITSLPGQDWIVAAGTTLLNPATMMPYAVGTPFTALPGVVNAFGQIEYVINGRHLSGVGYTINATSTAYPGLTLNFSNTCFATGTGAPLVCADNLFLSLPTTTCTMKITPGMILKSTINPAVNYSVVVLDGTNPISSTLTSANIGKTYTVKIIDGCDGAGNSCWGTIKLEDKEAPTIVCPTTPVTVKCSDLVAETNGTATFTSGQALGVVTAPTVTDCSALTRTYSDNVVDLPCAAGTFITKRIIRTYIATDAYNNSATCQQIINFQRIDLPITTTLAAASTSFDCNETFAKDANGNPAPSAVPAPFLTVGGSTVAISDVCDLSATYTDKTSPLCGGGIQINRQWVVVDNCTGKVFPTVNNQIIDIKDKTPPVFVSSFGDVTISTSTKDCFAEAELNLPIATDNCDKYLQFGLSVVAVGGSNAVSFLPVGKKVKITTLAVGKYVMTWRVTDACGNFKTNTQNLEVKDLIAPVVVCDQNTKISLTQDCKATMNAETLDDGSLDNCCLDVNSFRVARIGGDFTPTLEFGLADLAAPVMVQLQVKDCYGNTNVCMVNVLVEDKIAPVAFGRDTTVCCGSTPSATAWLNAYVLPKKLLIDYPAANNPGYYDNCGATVTREQSGSIDNCGNGTVTHKWTIKDNQNGTTATANVNYISENRSAYTVKFPADVTLTCNNNKSYLTTPQGTANVDNTTIPGNPVITPFGGTCPLVGVEYTDEVFKVVPDACFKIVRTWKVLNWCQPMPADLAAAAGRGGVRQIGAGCGQIERTYTNINELRPNGASVYDAGAPCKNVMDAIKAGESCYTYDKDGYMEYKQIIKVIDLTAPTLTAGKVTLSAVGKECKTLVTIESPTSSDCTGKTLDSYDIVNITNNLVVATGNTFPAKKEFTQAEFGKYVVRFKTTDQCGNFNSTDVAITVKDIKKPTPICHHFIATELMNTKMVMMNAKVLDAGSYDNCTPDNKLIFKIQVPAPNPKDVPNINPDTMKVTYTFTCPPPGTVPDPKNPNSYFITVALWVGDEAGNWDYCETVVEVQDNQDICGYSPIQMKPINGEVVTEKSATVENVMLKLSGTKKNELFSTITGKYQFADLPIIGQYSVIPEKNTQPLNGVSTLDLVLISKHILATQPLNSPYQLIAADVNKNGTVSTADIVELRKMILGLQTDFTKNTSWRFVDKSFTFPTPNNPFATSFPEMIEFKNGLNVANTADFVAVKIGDINGNALTNSAQQATGRGAKNTFGIYTDDQNYSANEEVKVTFKTKDIQSVSGYQFTFEYDKKNLELIDIQGDKDNFGVIENGVITTSVMTFAESNNELFTLVFKAKQGGLLNKNIKVTSAITPNEAYGKDGEALDVKLNFENQKLNLFELYQNRPNPFNDATVISFNLPESGKATLTINDVSGRVVKVIENDFAKGYNEVKIAKNELNLTGVLYYQLEQNGQKVGRKMVVIE